MCSPSPYPSLQCPGRLKNTYCLFKGARFPYLCFHSSRYKHERLTVHSACVQGLNHNHMEFKFTTMDWQQYEKQVPCCLFFIYDKEFKRKYFVPSHKLLMVLQNIQYSLISKHKTKEDIKIKTNLIPPSISFEQAIEIFQCTVQERHHQRSVQTTTIQSNRVQERESYNLRKA